MTQHKQNIAVIGGGIMGLSAAYALSKAEHAITLYDPSFFPANNASSIAGGMLAPYSEIEHMPSEWIEAGLAGIKFWQKNFPEIVHQNGSLLIAHEEDHHILERFRTHLPKDKQELVPVKPLEPAIFRRFTTGIHLTEEAHLEPHTTLFKLYKIIKEMSVTLQPSGYEPDELPGTYDRIIDCRGYGAVQDDPDLRGVKGEIVIVRNPDFNLRRPVRLMHPRYPLYIVPRENNIFMIGATVTESADEQISVRSGLELLSALYSLHPSFGEAQILEINAGIRPAYKDNLPRITLQDNIIRANGLFRHGYLLAPIMAEVIADYLAGKEHEFSDLFLKGQQNENNNKRKRKELRSAA